MKKITIVNGSPRGKNGNTAKIIDGFLKGYQSVELESQIEYIELHKENIKNCIGCFTCWTKTPGKCIHKDGMENLLQKLIDSDLVIWATPVYHYGMTSILKTFVERTLPLAEPFIVKEDGEYVHPIRYKRIKSKNIIISNCGFPDFSNFDILKESFDKITKNNIDESICCVMGELLSQNAMKGRLKWYSDTLGQAGIEYARNGKIESSTKEMLNQPLVPVDDFIEMANLSWDINNDIDTESVTKGDERTQNNKKQKGLSYLKLMRQSFVSENAKGIDSILEFEFTDLKETHHFIIKDQVCELVEGASNSFTTKIITTYETWLKISNGELEGAKAMMDGLYRIEGDLNFMMAMGKIFGSDDSKEANDSNEEPKKDKILGIKGQKWMGITFIPWIISWSSITFSTFFGVWIPLLLSCLIVMAKKKHKEVTYFEQMSFQYFGLLAIVQTVGTSLLKSDGALINYFAIALIWGASLFNETPLTSDYSKFDFNGNIKGNILFTKTNEVLTLFWSVIFIIQGILFAILKEFSLLEFTPAIYILTFGALKFTNWFSNWYPKYVAGGRRRK
ncbi:NAD(P)H-dependent oxidoreductase [Clostridium ganghwense]|uniref:NAD(P)H-dependent oxidoreductase n=1 Tax=Clostridium ganghwense TaxID=312089 RepID=A0ABT4CMQ3_9CLOT|nr:NAD(P)H-dependent oxidoreductase [Clostridium ganghwense]